MVPLPIVKPRLKTWESLPVAFFVHWAPGVANTAGASLGLVDLKPALNQVPEHSVSVGDRLATLELHNGINLLPGYLGEAYADRAARFLGRFRWNDVHLPNLSKCFRGGQASYACTTYSTSSAPATAWA